MFTGTPLVFSRESVSLNKRDMSIGGNGIINLGNTCYLNSVLQCLSNVPTFRNVLLDDDFTVSPESKSQGQLVLALAEFMKVMWSSTGVVMNTKAIRAALRTHTKKFDNNQQQDAQEFLLYLLEALNEETILSGSTYNSSKQTSGGSFRALHYWKKFQTKESSIFSDIFVGQLRSSVCCSKCNRTSTVYEIFWELSLPMPAGDSTLYDCLDMFFNGETIHSTCQYCKKQASMLKLYEIERLPPVLILWFKRFSSNFTQKITHRVRFPREALSMEAYISVSGRKRQALRSKYDLCAVSNHIGSSALHGHYTAYCRREVTGRWYRFDDTHVSAVDTQTLDGTEARCSAYILLYQRR